MAALSALVPCGTTGESATLSHDEHKRVVELLYPNCAPVACPLLRAPGSNSTKEAIELIEHAKTVGADAALVICPYYNKPDQAGLEAHFRAINEAVALPIVLYNVPSRTACDLLPETVAKLAPLPNIIGIKDASNDLGRVSMHAALTDGEQFTQLSGEDPSSLGHRGYGRNRLYFGHGERCAGFVRANACCLRRWRPRERAQTRSAAHSSPQAPCSLSPSPGPAKYVLGENGACVQMKCGCRLLRRTIKPRCGLMKRMASAGLS